MTIQPQEGIDLPSPTETLSWWIKNKNKVCGAILLLIGFFGGNVDRVTQIARDIIPDLSGSKQDNGGDGDVQSLPYYPEPAEEPTDPDLIEDIKDKVNDNASDINNLQVRQESLVRDIGEFGIKVEDLKDKVELLEVEDETKEEDNNGQIPIE